MHPGYHPFSSDHSFSVVKVFLNVHCRQRLTFHQVKKVFVKFRHIYRLCHYWWESRMDLEYWCITLACLLSSRVCKENPRPDFSLERLGLQGIANYRPTSLTHLDKRKYEKKSEEADKLVDIWNFTHESYWSNSYET